MTWATRINKTQVTVSGIDTGFQHRWTTSGAQRDWQQRHAEYKQKAHNNTAACKSHAHVVLLMRGVDLLFVAQSIAPAGQLSSSAWIPQNVKRFILLAIASAAFSDDLIEASHAILPASVPVNLKHAQGFVPASTLIREGLCSDLRV